MYNQLKQPDNPAIDAQNIGTRSHRGISFTLPHLSTAKYMNSFIYKGRVQWNKLPAEIQTIPEMSQFKSYLRKEIKQQEAGILLASIN